MKVSSSKEKILKKIREALSNPAPLPFPRSEGSASVFPPPQQDLELLFDEEFTRLSSKFAFCINEADMKAQLKHLVIQKGWKRICCVEKRLSGIFEGESFLTTNSSELAECEGAITSCNYLVARTGSIVMSSGQESGRTVSVYTPVHICIAYLEQLVFDTRDALKLMKEKYGARLPSFITFASGPARTEDIENTVVMGVQGPAEVYLFLIDAPAL